MSETEKSVAQPYFVIARDRSVPVLYGPFEDRYAANRHLRTLPDDWQRWTVPLTGTRQGAGAGPVAHGSDS